MTVLDPVEALLHDLVGRYPEEVRGEVLDDQPRQRFHLELVRGVTGRDRGQAVDLGGGFSLFGPALAATGWSVTVLDDYSDPWHHATQNGPSAVLSDCDVTIRDVIRDGAGLSPGSVDLVTTFDSIEHWHHSPRRLLAEVAEALRPGGWFVLGAPNRVNVRKRLSTLAGRGAWSQMCDWYEQPVFRGHVREPSVAELRFIAEDMGLVDARVLGRNWLGYRSPSRAIRAVTRLVDRGLQLRPTLCSDIYVVARKPA